MNSRRQWLGLLLAWAICASASAATNSFLRSDEVVIFYPTLGWRTTNGGVGGWEVAVHGCVYETEKSPVTTRLLRKAIGLDDDEMTAEERRIYHERSQLLLVDHERDKTLAVQLGGRVHELPKTGANGQTRATITLGEGALTNAANAASGGVLIFQALMRSEDSRAFVGRVHLLENDPRGWSVISDVDDTIKISEVRDRHALLKNTFTRPFRAVPGMSALYGSWATNRGASFHYVSGSPWQLYPALATFARAERFPEGSWHLKQFRLQDESYLQFFAPQREYKLGQIEPLLRRWPARQFVLVGDSGEQDPEIYGELARRFPQQIKRVFIRDVTDEARDSARMKEAFKSVPVEVWTIFRELKEIETLWPGRP